VRRVLVDEELIGVREKISLELGDAGLAGVEEAVVEAPALRRAEQRRRARQEREENSARGYTTIDPDERFDANIDMSDFFDDDNNYR